jgi:hypothetical protein
MVSERVPRDSTLVNFKLFPKNSNAVFLQIWRMTMPNAATDVSDYTYTVVHTQRFVTTQTDTEVVVSITFDLLMSFFQSMTFPECNIESCTPEDKIHSGIKYTVI